MLVAAATIVLFYQGAKNLNSRSSYDEHQTKQTWGRGADRLLDLFSFEATLCRSGLLQAETCTFVLPRKLYRKFQVGIATLVWNKLSRACEKMDELASLGFEP